MAFPMKRSASTASAVALVLVAGPVAAIDTVPTTLICLLAQSESIVVADVVTDGDRLRLSAVRERVSGVDLPARTTVSIRSRWDGPASARRSTALLFLKRAPSVNGVAWVLAGPDRSGLVWVLGGRLTQAPMAIPGYSETVPRLSEILPAIRDLQACTHWSVSGPATHTATFRCSPTRRTHLSQTSRLHRALFSVAERAHQMPGLRCLTSAEPRPD